MLKKILVEAAVSQSFTVVSERDNSVFLKRKDGRAERYLIIKNITVLEPIEQIHEQIFLELPESLSSEPSFNKNCDLVLIHKLVSLADFKNIEDKALEYEEDPYHFKKYFLYFSDAEERAINGKDFSSFLEIILNMTEFADYKKNPLKPSFYSIAARTFIKLPFLAVPRSKKILQALPDSVSARLAEEGLSGTLETVVKTANRFDVELIAQELINEELENIKTANSGI